eukprot:gene15348-18156_t
MVQAGAEQSLWNIFMYSGDPKVDALMQQGMVAMTSPETLVEAGRIFTEVVELKPDFAEAYNKRATVLYLQKEFIRSIGDCLTVGGWQKGNDDGSAFYIDFMIILVNVFMHDHQHAISNDAELLLCTWYVGNSLTRFQNCNVYVLVCILQLEVDGINAKTAQ